MVCGSKIIESHHERAQIDLHVQIRDCRFKLTVGSAFDFVAKVFFVILEFDRFWSQTARLRNILLEKTGPPEQAAKSGRISFEFERFLGTCYLLVVDEWFVGAKFFSPTMRERGLIFMSESETVASN